MVFSFPYFLSSWRIVGRVHFRWNVDQQKRIYVRQYFVRQKKQIAIRSCSGHQEQFRVWSKQMYYQTIPLDRSKE